MAPGLLHASPDSGDLTDRRVIMKRLYLILAVAGFVLPYYFYVSFLMAHGLDLQLLLSQLFANEISTFFAVDLIITAIVLIVFVYRESRRLRVRNWGVYVLVTLLVGPSCAFPLFLYVRLGKLETPVA
jgi:hypothetical protein